MVLRDHAEAEVTGADIVVVGAGVIGLSAACALRAEGREVLVLDRAGPAAGASAGNAGAFAFSDILPLASPGILRKAPGWLMDPLGPLSLPPAYAPAIAPWLLRFALASRPAAWRRAIGAQAALMRHSRAALPPFMEATGTAGMLRRSGNLEVYEGEAQFRAALPGWEAKAASGVEVEHLEGAALAAAQPGLAASITHGSFVAEWFSIRDPKDYVEALAAHLRAQGGTIRIAEVAGLEPAEGGVLLRLAGGAPVRARAVVLAAGAHSHLVARSLGDRVPLETERGYNTTLPAGGFDLRCQITFGGHGFVVTRIGDGIRVGGAVELGGLRRPPDFRRADAMLARARQLLPGLPTEGGRQWMGFRPSLPDSLPLISPARRVPQVIYAFGHGHLGLTQSAGTARLVADLVQGRPPGIDLAPFALSRF